MIDPKTFAANTLQLLQQDPRRYRNFGPWWWFVKALLKQFYTRDNLHLLGDYEPPDASDRLRGESLESLQSALVSACDDYRQNASFNLGRNKVEDANGERYILYDPDAGV